MGLIMYSCGHISGYHEPIHVKFGVWGFFHHGLLKYGHENSEMQKKKKIWWRHTSVLYRRAKSFTNLVIRVQWYRARNLQIRLTDDRNQLKTDRHSAQESYGCCGNRRMFVLGRWLVADSNLHGLLSQLQAHHSEHMVVFWKENIWKLLFWCIRKKSGDRNKFQFISH